MERSYRSSNGVFLYALLLILTALLLGLEAVQRIRSGVLAWGAVLALLAVAWIGCALYFLYRWGRVHIVIRSDYLGMAGNGPERRVAWSDVTRVREFRGPAYQLSLRGLLPGPYLPHGLMRGETVLAIDMRASTRMLFRQALIDSYVAFRQETVRSVGRDVEVDLHGRWWHIDDPVTPPPPASAGDAGGAGVAGGEDNTNIEDDDEADERAARSQLLGGLRSSRAPGASASVGPTGRPRLARTERADGDGFDR